MPTLHQHHAPHADRLLILFTGWGMDDRQTAHLADDSHDIWTVSDYTTPVQLPPRPPHHPPCPPAPPSLGVWAAAEAADTLPANLTAAIAVNGTLTPIDDLDGIPPAIFSGTADNWLIPRARQRFLLRMTGSPQAADAFPPPQRTPLDQQRELQAIAQRASAAPRRRNPFSCAIVATHDRIFPPDAQRHAWSQHPETRLLTLPDAPHAPFADFSSWSDFLHLANHA